MAGLDLKSLRALFKVRPRHIFGALFVENLVKKVHNLFELLWVMRFFKICQTDLNFLQRWRPRIILFILLSHNACLFAALEIIEPRPHLSKG